MIDESDQAKEALAQANTVEERQRLVGHSLKLRTDAANLLNKYRQTHPGETSATILGKLYDILESLYTDQGGMATPIGTERGDQLSKLAVELARTVDEASSIQYRRRLLELEWDRRNFEGIITRGKELFNASLALRDPENYEAMRYITMALFDYLPVQPYDIVERQLPASAFPEAMDVLLERLNTRRPGDIEIAKRFAEFIVSVGREGRNNLTLSASGQFEGKSAAERFAMARDRIDIMVQRNRDDPAAYLVRYHFLSQFAPTDEALDLASPDLQDVLKLAPSSNEGLILSGLHALRQSGIAARGGEQERARQWESEAEGYFRRTVKDNPLDPLGYQYLGEYLLLVKKSSKDAILVWNEGLKNSMNRSGNEELIGRLIMLLLQEGMVDEARARLGDLSHTIDEMRITRPRDVRRTRDIQDLLTARMYHTAANMAEARIEAAMRENRPEEAKRLRGVVQQQRFDAIQKFEEVLMDFGTAEEHYIIERRSVYYLLLPQSLIQLAQLKLDTLEFDRAATYFRRAARFPDVLKPALVGMSIAYQQSNRLDAATQALGQAAEQFSDDLSLRFTHAMVMFRSQVATNATTPATLDAVQKKLEDLENFRNELPQPWVLDIRLIHLGVARANLSNQADTILEAMNDALRKFRALERKQDAEGNPVNYVQDAEGNIKNYIDDPAFVAEMVGIYSSLASRSDFDRLLDKLRAFPDGEDAYYEARINDALRRASKNEAIDIIDEAIQNPRLSQPRKDHFVAMMQNLKGENVDSAVLLDETYKQLKTTFDESPETLKPQGFFVLAELSLDREDPVTARLVKDRLERLEGPAGTLWRYITVRLMLLEADLDYNRMREFQEEIVRYRAEWDRAYVLSAMIEERYLEANPGDTAVRDKLIVAYRNAIQYGNLQPEVWLRLLGHLEAAGHTEDARLVYRDAALRGLMLESRTGQLPQPYGRMYAQIQEAILNEDAIGADTIARQCIRLAEIRGVAPELLFTLHLTIGKVFLDASMFDSATRHLTITAQSGGRLVYPLALCVAKSGDIDGGFTLLLDEIDQMPSAMPELLPAVLVMMAQLQPSEEVLKRIDALMERIEKGERLTLRGNLVAAEEDHSISLGSRWVNTRKVQSLVVRFPENTGDLDPSVIQFIAPEDVPGEQPSEENTQ